MVPEPEPGAVRAAEALRGLCGGAVHLPGDPAYDEARMPWNLQVDDLPAAVAYPAFPGELAEVLCAAAAAGLRVAPQGTGHGAPPLAGRLSDAVLMRTSAMTELRIDAAHRTARVGAGVLWGDVVERAGALGLAALHTSSPGVGVVGSSLGGGLSWYARRHGLQCSSLTAAELVLADGTFVRATDEDDADLLWAARGGGGGFGVVTALEFELRPVERVHAGMLVWDWSHAARVLTEWGTWAADAPESLTTVARLFQAPEASWLPAEVSGRRLVIIDVADLDPAEASARRLRPLRNLRPEIDTVTEVPPTALAELQLDPREPTAVYADSVIIDDLPERAVDALVATAGPGSGSQLLFVEVRQLGGALARPAARPGALDRLDGGFLVLGVGIETGSGWAAVHHDAHRVWDALRPWASGTSYLSMADGRLEEHHGLRADSWQRLTEIRAAADPHRLFVSPHPVGEATPRPAPQPH